MGAKVNIFQYFDSKMKHTHLHAVMRSTKFVITMAIIVITISKS